MNEWTVITVIIALVGLGVTIGGPLLKLNTSITTLTVALGDLRGDVNKNTLDIENHKKDSHESHKRLWEHEGKQDKQIANHEGRISVLEKKENSVYGLADKQ